MVLSKLVEFKDFTLFRGITTQDVKEHLLERRKIYMRACELAKYLAAVRSMEKYFFEHEATQSSMTHCIEGAFVHLC